MKNIKKITPKAKDAKSSDARTRAALAIKGKKAVSGCPEL